MTTSFVQGEIRSALSKAGRIRTRSSIALAACTGLLAVAASIGTAASAETSGHDMSGHKADASKSTDKAAASKGKARVITIKMGPVKYDIKTLKVKAGEKIQFRFVNESVVTHEAIIGDEKVQAEHEAAMKKNPTMVHNMHPGAITVAPKTTKTMDYTFAKAGRTIIGCHQPAHYAGGMKIQVVIGSATGL
jgi:uncharacterized cupredoxin-like copper-binding protein